MLTAEKNKLLTQVGADTPMGKLLRRYWHPIAAVDELDKDPVKPIRLMGEDLVLYKDLSGTYGLIDRHCPHRRADLALGFTEKCGLRCNYHGWAFDERGLCIAQPFEETMDPEGRLKKKIRTVAYPVKALGGLLWAYMGPPPTPELANWEPFGWPNGFRQIVFAEVPCNWLQCQENSIDPVHFEWMHDNWSKRLRGQRGPYAPSHVKLRFEEFDYGFIYKRLREGMDESHPHWQVGRVCLWPNGFFLGEHFEWRVPIDDETTLSVTWVFMRVPNEQEPYVQKEIPSWWGPIKDEKNGRWISSHVMNQDFIAWIGQGTIADRSKENLGASDRGVAMLRKCLFDNMMAVENGEDPKGVIRDPLVSKSVRLPAGDRELFIRGLPLEQLKTHPIMGPKLYRYPYQAGQPSEIQQACRQAMGLADENV